MNRILSLLGRIWAKDAIDAPQNPVTGTTYRKSTISQAEVEAGWAYDSVVKSSIFNEIFRMVTQLVSLNECCGILPWSSLTEYTLHGLALGSNGEVYRSLEEGNVESDPTTTPAKWVKAFTPVYAVDTGDANLYEIAPVPDILAHTVMAPIGVKFVHANTGPSTIVVNGLPPVMLARVDGTYLRPGDLRDNTFATIVWDGFRYRILTPLPGLISMADFEIVMAVPGRLRFPPLLDGKRFMIQWGMGAPIDLPNYGNTQTLNFQTPFTSTVLLVFVTGKDQYGNTWTWVSNTLTDVTVNAREWAEVGQATAPVFLAIGW